MKAKLYQSKFIHFFLSQTNKCSITSEIQSTSNFLYISPVEGHRPYKQEEIRYRYMDESKKPHYLNISFIYQPGIKNLSEYAYNNICHNRTRKLQTHYHIYLHQRYLSGYSLAIYLHTLAICRQRTLTTGTKNSWQLYLRSMLIESKSTTPSFDQILQELFQEEFLPMEDAPTTDSIPPGVRINGGMTEGGLSSMLYALSQNVQP